MCPNLMSAVTAGTGTLGDATSTAGFGNEVQTVTVPGTVTTFTLTFNRLTTGGITLRQR